MRSYHRNSLCEPGVMPLAGPSPSQADSPPSHPAPLHQLPLKTSSSAQQPSLAPNAFHAAENHSFTLLITPDNSRLYSFTSTETQNISALVCLAREISLNDAQFFLEVFQTGVEHV